MRKPTVIGQAIQPTRAPDVQPQQAAVPAVTLDTGAIVLQPDQQQVVQQKLAALNFEAVTSADIHAIGQPAELALQQTLDGFLAGLDKKTAADVFELFGRLDKGVADADLPEIQKRIKEGGQPGVFGNVLGRFHGKSAADIAQEVLQELGKFITGKTDNLVEEMDSIKRDLDQKMQILVTGLKALDELKKSYGEHFNDFTIEAAVLRAFAVESEKYVNAEVEKANANPADLAFGTHVQDLQSKLRNLQSRALAMEGGYTSLPASALVIKQIEQAGVSTLQETSNTLLSRFASIKTALLAINGAYQVTNLQQATARLANIDRQVNNVMTSVTKDAAITAAQTPGDNRLAQAQQIEKIIADMAVIRSLVKEAEEKTDQNFEVARQKFAAARAQLTTMATS